MNFIIKIEFTNQFNELNAEFKEGIIRNVRRREIE